VTDSPLPLIVNRAGGSAAAVGDALADTLKAAFAKAGTAIDLHLVEGADIPETFRRLAGHNRVAVAGGDGTIACAAQAARGTDVEIALLPLGTLNHLARDLGVPVEIDAAAELAVGGRAVVIDVGDVNGHRFVNNASIGVYPEMVRSRDDTRERTGWPKWLATAPAAWQVLARLTHHRLHVDMGTGAQPLITPLLFVGNNHYALDAGEVGRRSSLSGGRLSVYAVAHRTRLSLIWFALRALAGRADRKRDFVAIGDCEALTVWSSGRSIEIALDGELLRLQSPLRFCIEPGALNVVAP
jgi:diacylglycerol kinase family enzyme